MRHRLEPCEELSTTLTDTQADHKMLKMVRGRAFVSLLMLFGVLTSAWATCAEGATAPVVQQMACCKNGHHQCRMKNSASDCCKQSGPRFDERATFTKTASFVAPVPFPVAWVTTLTVPSIADAQRGVSIESSPPNRLCGPPPYIAFSALLI